MRCKYLAEAKRFNDNGQIIQCFVRFRGYNSTPFPKHTLVSMSLGPPGGFERPRGLCSEEDKYMLLGMKMDHCQCLPHAQHTVDYECVEYINRIIFWTHKLTHKLNPFGLLSIYIATHPKSIYKHLTERKRCGWGELLAFQKMFARYENKTKKTILVINVRRLQPCWPLSAKQNQQRTSRHPLKSQYHACLLFLLYG